MNYTDAVEPEMKPLRAGPRFVKVQRMRSVDEVVKQLREAIISGEVPRGERLPGEREMCELFGVSRPTLREALRSLEALGIVAIRVGKGGGAYAVAPSVSTLGDALATLVNLRGASPQDLAEFRLSFEAENAAWAAQRATAADMYALDEVLERVRIAADNAGDWRAVGEVDTEWHQAVARATQNRVRIGISLGIHDALLRNVVLLRPALVRYFRSIVPELALVTEAIRDRDAAAAEAGMHAHIERWNLLQASVANKSTRQTPARIGEGVGRVASGTEFEEPARAASASASERGA